jgi:epoxyqueuosine reductase
MICAKIVRGEFLIDDLSLTESIRAEARRLGFFKMGVAAAGPLPWKSHFDAWLAQGMQGKMTYLVRQAGKRCNPALVLHDVRSILALAMNYYPGNTEFPDPLRGRISRYALCEDYHRLMAERLRSLLDFIMRERPGTHGIYYADTGPVMEKVWGAHSALGWMGKHTNLISREKGSWFFIGVLLLDINLAYDDAERDHCGTCTRCIQACPTGAIITPYLVDARLCISYLTIELKGAIPRHLRLLIGNRIFGCDDCQEVCPWNRLAISTLEPAFQPRADSLGPELVPLTALTEAEFKTRFKNSAMRRVGRDGFVRNVVIALGNSRRPEAVPALTRALWDGSALVRGHAAWALGRIGGVEAIAVLEQALCSESDPAVRQEIELAL